MRVKSQSSLSWSTLKQELLRKAPAQDPRERGHWVPGACLEPESRACAASQLSSVQQRGVISPSCL